MPNKNYLNTDEAAGYLGGLVPAETLKMWRSRGRGPRYVKTPNGRVRYRTADLDQFLAAHVVEPKGHAA